MRRVAITTIGNIVVDMLWYTDQAVVMQNPGDVRRLELLGFEKAAKLVGKDFRFTFGGGAANTAATFSRFGFKTKIVGAVGADALGTDCIANLRAQGIDTRLLQRVQHEETGLSFIATLTATGDHVIFVHRGASGLLQLTPSHLRRVKTPYIYVTSLAGSWRKNIDALFTHASRRRLRIAWNPGGEQLASGKRVLGRYLKSAWLCIMNADEATELVSDSNTQKRPHPRVLARALQRLGSTLAVVTDGHRGSYLADGKRVFYQKAIRTRIVNKTGAGDAFGSALVSGLMRHGNIQRALTLAAHNSASVVGARGAQIGILSYRDAERFGL